VAGLAVTVLRVGLGAVLGVLILGVRTLAVAVLLVAGAVGADRLAEGVQAVPGLVVTGLVVTLQARGLVAVAVRGVALGLETLGRLARVLLIGLDEGAGPAGVGTGRVVIPLLVAALIEASLIGP
jgi:hypothetical protein